MDAFNHRLLQAVRDAEFDWAVCITDLDLDPPGPTVLQVNDRFERLTGYAAADIVGRPFRVLQGPKTDPVAFDRLRRTLQAGGLFRGRTTTYRQDGTEFDMAWSVSGVGVGPQGAARPTTSACTTPPPPCRPGTRPNSTAATWPPCAASIRPSKPFRSSATASNTPTASSTRCAPRCLFWTRTSRFVGPIINSSRRSA